jgi:hypothetical protein
MQAKAACWASFSVTLGCSSAYQKLDVRNPEEAGPISHH